MGCTGAAIAKCSLTLPRFLLFGPLLDLNKTVSINRQNQEGEHLSAQGGLSLADILASLSYALDLTGGQPMGHAQRTCLIGMRLAQELGLTAEEQDSLYYALLVKDAGCSSNAARMCEIFGSDEIAAKRHSKLVDWSSRLDAARYAAAHTLPEGSLRERLRRLFHLAKNPGQSSDDLLHARCDRGTQIVRSLGLSETTVECVRHLDEHWDGRGGPNHVQGDAIPLLGRIACLAQTLEVFVTTFDVETAYAVLCQRSGRWFDPQLVRAAHAFRYDLAFWRFVQEASSDTLLRIDVGAATETISEGRVEAVCQGFAGIIDAKSPFTAEHSSRVSLYAVEIAQDLGIKGQRLMTLRRAALLHDIGKLAVPNTILDKPGKLTGSEWECVQRHPYYSEQVLGRITGFERMAEIAAAHHERLDGSGYFRELTGDQLDLDMRILAVADVFDALSAERPYREALPLEDVFLILGKEAGVKLDVDCVSVLRQRHTGSTLAALVESGSELRLAA